MKFAFTIPKALLIVLAAGNIAAASELTSQPPVQLPSEFSSEKQDNRSQSATNSNSVIRAMYNFLFTQSHFLESDLSFIVNVPGTSVRSDVQIQTIIKQPNQFQSFIQFGDANSGTSSQYVVTSDGQQVWISDVNQNIYSVMTYKEFMDDYENSFLVGLFTVFVLGFTEDMDVELLAGISEEELLQDEALLQQFEADLDMDSLTIGTETVNGNQYITLTYAEPDEFAMTLSIDPVTLLIENIRSTSSFDGTDIFMQENIVHKAPPASIPPDTFTFLPPDGAQLSDTPIFIYSF